MFFIYSIAWAHIKKPVRNWTEIIFQIQIIADEVVSIQRLVKYVDIKSLNSHQNCLIQLHNLHLHLKLQYVT